MTREQVEKIIDENSGKRTVFFITKDYAHEVGKNDVFTYHGDYVTNRSNGSLISYSNITHIRYIKPLNIQNSFKRLGSDPEFFFTKDDKVVPSNLVLPEEGSDVIRDGFQGELNPATDTCRQTSGTYIARAIAKAVKFAEESGTKISLKVGHTITDDVWKKTSLGMRRFGCNPTENAHEQRFRRVTGTREKFRAAGGHIHMALDASERNDLGKVVMLMDIVAGNTCVLVDRDPDNAKRRKNYGRAGEHRIKDYGLEYRVLSNFWLKSYTLWSMATILLRNAVSIHKAGLADELISKFDMKKVREAINNNDFELAKENFQILSEFLKEKGAYGNGLSVSRIDKFYKWATSTDPLSNWDTIEKTISNWDGKLRSSGMGFERFIDNKK